MGSLVYFSKDDAFGPPEPVVERHGPTAIAAIIGGLAVCGAFWALIIVGASQILVAL